MAATVTIDQAYFETLLRRAEFHTSGRDFSTPVDVPLVNIPKVDHDNLLRMAQEYNSLREALFRGGIEQETLEVGTLHVGYFVELAEAHPSQTLIHGEQSSLGPLNDWVDDSDPATQGPNLFSRRPVARVSISRPRDHSFDTRDHFGSRWQPSSSVGGGSGYNRGGRGYYSRHNSSAQEDDNDFTPDYEKEDGFLSAPRPERRFYERAEQRTLLAKNLHERTTHRDITDFVRGGTLLDIYLRSNDKTASISFVEGQNAQNFMNFIKRNDIYVHGKRLEWAWNDRQFILPGHVANKIGIGATRNLVIRNCSPSITENKLREDLDHIHNLVIIDIAYANGDCHIALNSIHNSLFARTCLMSRAAYKGMKIEWYEDECSLPLPEPKRLPKENRPPSKKKASQPMNRFQMLGIDGNDSEDEGEDEDDDVTTTTNMTNLTLNARTPWDVSSSVAA